MAKKLFTVDEYHRMGEAGIFHLEARLELIEGEIIEMSPVGDRDIVCVNRLTLSLRPVWQGHGERSESCPVEPLHGNAARCSPGPVA